MFGLLEQRIHCPYCGEPITILVDLSEPEQEYIEDCQVCCRPIVFKIKCAGSEPEIWVQTEND